MGRRLGEGAARDLARVFDRGAAGPLSDRELLERFLRGPGRAGEEAFSALVERHGPTVLTVCRRMLADAHEAEDAFQATFLVLARKAPAISGRERVGNWLYGVALRVAREGKRRADRRARRERLLGDDDAGVVCSSASVEADPAVEELRAAVVEELSRLPDRYRGPLLLCDLEGRSRREAAERLGLAEGTVSSRLARGRDLLRGRLVRRGLAPAAVIGAMGGQAKAIVPASLVTKAAEAAGVVAWRGVAAGAVPAAVSGLAGEVIRTMFLMKLKAGMLTVAAVGAATTLAIGGAWAIGPRGGGPPVAVAAIEPPAPVAEDEPEEEDSDWPIARGVVVDEEGRPVVGAAVEVCAPGDRHATGESDAEGRFAILVRRKQLGGEPVVASAEGEARMGIAVYDWQKARDGEEEILQVVLKPSREVVIRAEDEEGGPVDGATIEVMADLSTIVLTRTDEQGRADVRLPVEAPITWAFGLKGGVGFDYAELSPRENQGIPASEIAEEIVLALDGARTIHVKAIDRAGNPLEGISLHTWLIKKPGKRDDINIGGARSVATRTGADGIVTFDWLPTKTTVPISVMRGLGEFHAPDRTLIGPELPSGDTVTAEFVRNGAIRGRVTHADGSPAGGVAILASGTGSGFDNSSRVEGRTDEDGTFEVAAQATQCYMIGVVDEEWAAPSRSGIIVGEGQTVDGIDFTLGRGAIIRGTLALGPDDEPVPDGEVSLREDGGMMPEELRREGDRVVHRLGLYRQVGTDDQGNFRVRVGPGTYRLGGPSRSGAREVKAVEGHEYEVDFRMSRPARGPVVGRVVLASDPSRGVEGADITANRTDSRGGGRWMNVTTGPDGRFENDRPLDPLMIFARTRDGALAGIVASPADETEVVIPIGPTASATGIALDHDGTPMANVELDVMRKMPKAESSGGGNAGIPFPKVTTDAEGRFEVRGMVIGHAFEVSWKTEDDRYYPLVEITPVEPGLEDLGTLKLGESYRRRQEEAKLSFLPDAPGAGDEAPAVEATTLDGESMSFEEYEGKYVLIHFWATWSSPCFEAIPTLDAVFEEFGERDEFAMLGLSIDEAIEAPRDFQNVWPYRWRQGFVEGSMSGPVPGAFGVRAIPALVLVGPDGKIVARGMRGEQIREEVAKALGMP